VTRRPILVLGTLAVCAGIAAGAAVLQARETRAPLPVSSDRWLYVQSNGVARRIFLSFQSVASDIYWIRTIQHYGRDRVSARTADRFALLQPLLDLTTTLDPRFNIPYRFGAIFLSMSAPNGPGRPDEAIALLEKGLASNPTRWQYAHDIGFVHYWYTKDYEEAARWFEKAAEMPGAPDWLRPLAATSVAAGGDRRGARRLLGELLTADEKYIRQAAERGLAQLQALDAIDVLQGMVEQYHARIGTYPQDWSALVRTRQLPGTPLDSSSTPFRYDPESHRVGLSPLSPLGPLPAGFLGPR
jgi:tetratricopeptide (TPR) repeat protein